MGWRPCQEELIERANEVLFLQREKPSRRPSSSSMLGAGTLYKGELRAKSDSGTSGSVTSHRSCPKKTLVHLIHQILCSIACDPYAGLEEGQRSLLMQACAKEEVLLANGVTAGPFTPHPNRLLHNSITPSRFQLEGKIYNSTKTPNAPSH